MLTLNDGRSELWQWDTGRKLTVDADCTQVHFSNKFFGRSVDVDVADGVAEIPDVLLQVDKDLLVWAFVGTAENGYTKISKVFKVNKRNKPADYVFTPTEQTTLGELIERLGKIEESQDPDAIKNAVDDYLSNNPIEIDETDPTVPEWAKEKTKPSYSKSEVGLGNVDNVKQYSPSNPPPYPVVSVNGQTGKVQLGAAGVGARPSNWMPTAQEVGALPDTYVPPNQTAAQVGADPAGTATAAVSTHNTSTDSHGDLRLELKAISDRLTAFFDSDNQTLDELSEIVAYITSNKALIDSITTSKVSVADIINNLTTNVANKPLSAAQGVALKGLIDVVSNSLSNYQPKGDYALRSELPTVPTKVSQLQNDKGYLTEHQDISGKLDADKLPEAINTALAQAKDSGEFDGDPGAPGKDGTSVTVKSVSESTADGGSNVVTFSDGKTLTVKNGKQGSAGKNGADGKTPVKGVDFWTDADQEAIVQQVITALGTPVFGRVDADNNIILTGVLADGTYTIKYEDAEGNQTEIGTLEQGASYKNLADPSSPDWLTNKRLNSSGAITDTTPSLTTNYIPVQLGDFVRIRFVNIFHQGYGTSSATTHFYDANKNRIASITPVNANVDHIIMDADGLGCSFDMTKASEKFTMVSGHSASEIQFARFVGKLYDGYTKEDVIITVNQEITD